MASSVSRRAALGGGLAVLLGGSGTAGWALNRYVIDHAEVTNASEQTSTAIEAVQASTKATTSTATSYQSDTATISIKTVETGSGSDKVTYYVADITVSDATIVKSAFADDSFGTNIIAYPSVIAEQAGAVLAINGDYYGFRETGIEIRNGIIYRDAGARQGLAFYQDGSMKLYDETATNAKTLLSQGVWQTLSFGPGLLQDGKILDGIEDVEVDTNFGNHSIQGQQPRTGIGWIEDNHLLFVAVDGRSSGYSRGVTMTEMAEIFAGLGAKVAYNLDGGGSTAMVFNGALVNNPLGKGKERGTSDIIYIAG
ncbi:phosphodiester glycosidase family protein [Nostocoides jenkinsii]|uniref:Exopolysaccharide biosynthesis protein n=1 Tax=Nostocoides jenkinsii Ben 74 TaxID=1193518 RepID=A0A077M990_9MICO|nr:phosphodiester glycosidase family protein [Tetrasphaera jenkinsii]CCI51377.1 Exopolysaccharide biosynthesis protein [Tetrasphaera jenkinsii Ben 74]